MIKEKIRQWLKIKAVEGEVDENFATILKLEKRINALESEISENQRGYKFLNMYVKGLLEYFDLSFTKEYIKDPSVFYEHPEIPIIKVVKKRK